MEGYQRVASFTYPHEMLAIEARFKSEGIDYHIADDLIVGVFQFASNAVGGIKLIVADQDVERALKILGEEGYDSREEVAHEVKLLARIDKFTSKIPLLGRLPLLLRLFSLLIVPALVVAIILSILLRPTITEVLVAQDWCLVSATHNGNDVSFETIPHQEQFVTFQIDPDVACLYYMRFEKMGRFYLEGLPNNMGTYGTWSVVDDELIIEDVNYYPELLNASFDVDYNGNSVIFESDQAVIKVEIRRFHFGF